MDRGLEIEMQRIEQFSEASQERRIASKWNFFLRDKLDHGTSVTP